MADLRPKDFIDYEDLPEEEVVAFNKILRNIYRRRGVDFRQYRPKCLRRRVVVGMHDAKVDNFADYFLYLNKNPDEYDNLLDRITINVSEFFRNPETFKAVKKTVIPEIVNYKKTANSPSIRIWSSGCATGEEPYSLAILLKETLEELKEKLKIRIFATDIDQEALRRAQEGVYKEKALKELHHRQVKEYFNQTKEGLYQINDELKTMIRFEHHNMISDSPLQRMDLIFCRNVIIYFSKELQKKVYDNFHEALAPNGFLVAGKTESLMDINETYFQRVNLQERILRKKPRIEGQS
jgi:chemotaxis protein methyltransferase CheR